MPMENLREDMDTNFSWKMKKYYAKIDIPDTID